MQPVVETEIISVSPSAVKAIRDLLNERNLEGYALRIFVSGKTCSGYQYGMSLDESSSESDTSIETDGIKVVIDNESREYIKGGRLDFIDDERGKIFMIDNPNAAASCGCESGSSCESGGCCS
jgi:iron-sulfur cluster assembly accessory protein